MTDSYRPFMDYFNAQADLDLRDGNRVKIFRLDALEKQGIGKVSRLPYSIKIMVEAAMRQCNEIEITREDVVALANWEPAPDKIEVPYLPARVVLQDFTGVPSIVDLAAMRSALARLGGDSGDLHPVVPVDLVMDHSLQVDRFGSVDALRFNADREFKRNLERYKFIRWGKDAFANFRVVPPMTGIVHQVNLEYLAQVVMTRDVGGRRFAFPDTLVGADSHTTMINGLGVVGWGVGGIEAEAVMLGQPIYMLLPQVVGVRLEGDLSEGVTATDLVLTITETLRRYGMVGKIVEFFGPGVNKFTLADRATISNMCPEYGATMGFFPVDNETLSYLRLTGRSPEIVTLVERFCKEQGLFRTDDAPEPKYTDVIPFHLGKVEPSLAGPRRPQDRVPLQAVKVSFERALAEAFERPNTTPPTETAFRGATASLQDGSVVIAAITSCTNTSNPAVMIGAGLLAKKAIEAGLSSAPYVKTSIAPGSRVVTHYLNEAGLTPFLEALGFHTVGYGCTTCIGNSGALRDDIAQAIIDQDLVVAAVLSGNRNFEGRIHPLTRANYLASPPLVVAYAIAGRVNIDLTSEALGTTRDGRSIYLRDIWPSLTEIQEVISSVLKPEIYRAEYRNVFDGSDMWNRIEVTGGQIYAWDDISTYIKEPPFFLNLSLSEAPISTIRGARVLALLGDSITTDHISPAGSIPADSPAGRYLTERGIEPTNFNSYGARRGNHEVMMRGTFANIRLQNLLAEGIKGGRTLYLSATASNASAGEQMSIYDAAMRYQAHSIPLVIIAGKEYGTGSSRDWAAKGSNLLGIKAVLAESFERTHRSNLVGMGVLPLQFSAEQNAQALGLTGFELYDIEIGEALQPRQLVTVRACLPDGSKRIEFSMLARIDTPVELEYYRHGGILHRFLRRKMAQPFAWRHR